MYGTVLGQDHMTLREQPDTDVQEADVCQALVLVSMIAWAWTGIYKYPHKCETAVSFAPRSAPVWKPEGIVDRCLPACMAVWKADVHVLMSGHALCEFHMHEAMW